MTSLAVFQDMGLLDYKSAWDIQEECFEKIVAAKLLLRERPENHKEVIHQIFFVEHPHVYTLGKSGNKHNLLINQNFLDTIHASYVVTNRGGDITYHGPGQLVGYPILDLEALNIGIKGYIHLLEEAIIRTIDEYGLTGHRLDGATGVWLDPGIPGKVRKICAIGVRASRYVSMHGFALNVNTNLKYFQYINPCGFVDKGVTSLQNELGTEVPMSQVKSRLIDHIQSLFDLRWVESAT